MGITIRSTLIALLLWVVVSAGVVAQGPTTLGMWVLSQPASVGVTIGCDVAPPYSMHCWQHIVRDGRIVSTRHFRQHDGYISMWEVRNYGR